MTILASLKYEWFINLSFDNENCEVILVFQAKKQQISHITSLLVCHYLGENLNSVQIELCTSVLVFGCVL